MPKKFRKGIIHRTERVGAGEDPVKRGAVSDLPLAEPASVALEKVAAHGASLDAPSRRRPSVAPPIAQPQERELEAILGFMGAIMGGLTGYSQVPMDAVQGNIQQAVAGVIMGILLGYCLGRTLFLSTKLQWLAWILLLVLTFGGFLLAGMWGTVAGPLVTAGMLLYGDGGMPRASIAAICRGVRG